MRQRVSRTSLTYVTRELKLACYVVIAKETNFVAEVQLLNLGDFASVVAFARRLEKDPIDIVVANAGVSLPEYQATKDGWEETYSRLPYFKLECAH